MKTNSLIRTIIASAVVAPMFAVSSVAMAAAWDKCGGCHNGKSAPDKAALQKKHKSADAFVKAGKESKSPMMKAFQSDADLKGAAADLGLK